MFKAENLELLFLPSMALEEKARFPKIRCIYFALDMNSKVQYIGKSINLHQRWLNHHRYSALQRVGQVRIAWLNVSDTSLLNEIELALIDWFDPPLNKIRVKILRPTETALLSYRTKVKVADLKARGQHWNEANHNTLRKAQKKYELKRPTWSFRPAPEILEWLEGQRLQNESNSALLNRLLEDLRELEQKGH